jgi:hypothetical protein
VTHSQIESIIELPVEQKLLFVSQDIHNYASEGKGYLYVEFLQMPEVVF